MSPTERKADPSAKWFLRVHPLVWVIAGILLLFAASRWVVGDSAAVFATLGPFGFWLVVTTLAVLLVILLILTKQRPEAEKRP